MKAIIMAGGFGSRLKPLTNDIPKPMVPIINKPIIAFIVNLLVKHNITDIAMTLGYKPECIMNYFGDGAAYGANVTYYIEGEPLGTAGSIKNTGDFIDDEVVIISGDAFTNINLDELIACHHDRGGLLTMAVKYIEEVSSFGVVRMANNGEILSFIEKPRECNDHMVNTGIYVMSKQLLEYIPSGVRYDFARDVFPSVMGKIYATEMAGYWSDIGTLSSYYLTNNEVASNLAYYNITI